MFEGNVTSIVNYGSVTSIFSKDQNERLIKERLVKTLSKKLYNHLILKIRLNENSK